MARASPPPWAPVAPTTAITLLALMMTSWPGCYVGGRGQRLRHPVLERRNRLQVRKDGFQVRVGEVLVNHDRHRRQDLAAASHVPPAADRFLEVARALLAQPGFGIRREVRGKAHAPRSGPCG